MVAPMSLARTGLEQALTGTPNGQEARSAGAIEGVEHVGPLKMSVDMAQPTTDTAEHWARRSEALANWLAAEWRADWIPPRPRGRGRSSVRRPPADQEKRT